MSYRFYNFYLSWLRSFNLDKTGYKKKSATLFPFFRYYFRLSVSQLPVFFASEEARDTSTPLVTDPGYVESPWLRCAPVYPFGVKRRQGGVGVNCALSGSAH